MAEAVCPSHNSRNCRSWSAPAVHGSTIATSHLCRFVSFLPCSGKRHRKELVLWHPSDKDSERRRTLTRPQTDRAFERLYRRHVHDVYRYVLAVLRNPADAEDVTQATFLNAFRPCSAATGPSLLATGCSRSRTTSVGSGSACCRGGPRKSSGTSASRHRRSTIASHRRRDPPGARLPELQPALRARHARSSKAARTARSAILDRSVSAVRP